MVSAKESNEEAREFYLRLCVGDTSGVVPHRAIDPQSDEVIYPDGSTGKPGVSGGARCILGSVALLLAAIFVYSEQLAPSRAPLAVYVLASFCDLMALACFAPGGAAPLGRILGFVVFLAFA